MKNILILDDDPSDTRIIKTLLQKSQYAADFSIFIGTSMEKYAYYASIIKIDLLVLDLEFTASNTTSISFMNNLPSDLPIIIVSHHRHYQHLLNTTGRIFGFIPKSSITDLLPLVEKALGFSSSPTSESFIFPPSRIGSSFTFPTSKVRYIQKVDRCRYTIYPISGDSLTIMSSTWNNVVKELETQQITTLKPVTQGIIINVTCISSIEKLRSGLYSITLVNLPNLPFTVSPKYEKLYGIFFS